MSHHPAKPGRHDPVVGIIEAITRAGGAVEYNWGWTPGTNVLPEEPYTPGRFVDLIDVDYFDRVTDVWFISSTTSVDAASAQVGCLSRLHRLHLSVSSLSDAGLPHPNLEGLTELTCVDLRDARVTDAGLVHLKGLTKLTDLNLNGTQVTDAGVAHLKALHIANWPRGPTPRDAAADPLVGGARRYGWG
jgi:Leucine Rich repeat